MRSGYALGPGPVLVKSPNARRQAHRRRLLIACGFVALAIVSGVLGSLAHPTGQPSTTGPFSYFPSE